MKWKIQIVPSQQHCFGNEKDIRATNNLSSMNNNNNNNNSNNNNGTSCLYDVPSLGLNVNLILSVLITIVTIPSNLTLILIYMKFPKLRDFNNTAITMLSATDLLRGLVVMTTKIHNQWTRVCHLSFIVCHVTALFCAFSFVFRYPFILTVFYSRLIYLLENPTSDLKSILHYFGG